jgi:hypothetical protein
MKNPHQLELLLDYLKKGTDNPDSIYLRFNQLSDDRVLIRVGLGNYRVFVLESFPNKETAMDKALHEILILGIDMILDDELWSKYKLKLKDKYNV